MAVPQNQHLGVAMSQSLSQDEKIYFKELGARIAQRREELDLTQQQVADAVHLTQQTYAHYEVGRYRLPVSLIPALAEVLSMDVEVLLGMAPKNSKRGPVSRIQRYLEQIGQLPKDRQKLVFQMLEMALTQHSR